MKRIIQSFLCPALALLIALCSCTKAELQEQRTSPDGSRQTILATVNAGTKVNYQENGEAGTAGLKSNWETGDSFYAIQDGTKIVQFTLLSGAGETRAIFKAETDGVTSDTEWVAVLGSAAVPYESEIHCSYMNQSGKLSDLDQHNYVKATGSGEAPFFDFESGTKYSYILRIALPAGVKCVEYTPCGWNKVTGSSEGSDEVIYLNSSEENNYGESRTSTISLDAASSAGEFVYIAVPCLDFSRTYQSFASGEQYGNLRAGVIITLLNDISANATLSDGSVFEDNLTGKGGKIATVDMTAKVLGPRPTPAQAVEFHKTGDIQCKLHSSALTQKAKDVHTFWSPFNIGASKPSEVGEYLALGEFTTKSEFTFPKYTLRHKTKSTNRNDLLSSEFKISGTKFGYTMAGTRYDAARVRWGVAWRMPHMIEVYAASNGTTSRDTQDGVSGIKFTDGSGNSIFIPNSRYMDGTTLNSSSSPMAKDYTNDNYDAARFWSADQLNRSYNNAGWNEVFTFGNTNATPTNYDYWRRQTYLGFPIRPVLASSTLSNN